LQSLVHDAKSAFSLKSNRPSEWWGNIGKHLARTTNWRWRQTLGAHCVGPFPARQETTESWTFCEVQVYAKKTLRRCSTGNMGVGRIYFQGGANTIFPVGETVAQFHFVNTDSTRNTFVSSKVIRETANCKIQGVTLPFHPFRRPWWGDVLFSTSQQKPSGEAQC